jgi:hypothetical protein
MSSRGGCRDDFAIYACPHQGQTSEMREVEFIQNIRDLIQGSQHQQACIPSTSGRAPFFVTKHRPQRALTDHYSPWLLSDHVSESTSNHSTKKVHGTRLGLPNHDFASSFKSTNRLPSQRTGRQLRGDMGCSKEEEIHLPRCSFVECQIAISWAGQQCP